MAVCADICSPELAKFMRGESDEPLQVDDKDDIWALGVITLYLTTGQHPYRWAHRMGRSLDGCLASARRGSPLQSATVLLRALARRPAAQVRGPAWEPAWGPAGVWAQARAR